MAMGKRDLYSQDSSYDATKELEYVIRSKKKPEDNVSRLSVSDALTHKRLVEVKSSREITRILFISQNTELLNPTKQSLDGYVNLSDLFDEVHILILRTGLEPKDPVIRVGKNVWLYTAASRHWWQLPATGLKVIEEQLSFATGFRPDLIVARDPFESAVVAYKAGLKYQRTTQLHILDDYTNEDFIKKDKKNLIRRFTAANNISKFNSVRVSNGALQKFIQRNFQIDDLSILPKYQDYDCLIKLESKLDLKEKYKPFVFVMLFVGKLSFDSTAYVAIDASRYVLKNPRVGMVILGDGPSQKEFKDRTKILEIEKQVVFESKVDDIDSYLKSANMLIVTDTDADSEELVLRAAAAGIPMVMSRTARREDIFVHGESAYLCESGDVQSFTDRIDDLLNDISLREQFSINAQEMIKKEFHHNFDNYKEEYRASIEQAFFIGPESTTETKSVNGI